MPSIDVMMPMPESIPVDTDEHSPSLPVIGIIYPPPEVRNIVDKTASFVARNGPEFESRIRQNELSNPKFNFLNSGDPYNAYYQHKVKEIREGRGLETAPASAAPQPQKTATGASQLKQQELLKQSQVQEPQPFVLKDPPQPFEFIADPPSISAIDLDIVKLTAQFVARNGRSFLTDLMNREQRNYQFDFLRPQHSLFQYFTKLLEQYTKILIPPKDLTDRLMEESLIMQSVLDQVKYRAEWEKHEEAQRNREEQIIERERVAYAQIDWHDFVVVETVDYQIGEMGNFPAPTTPDEVGARVLMQDRKKEKKVDNKDENEMQMGSDDEDRDKNKSSAEESSSEESESETEEDAHQRVLREIRSKEGKDNTQVEDMEEESSSEDEQDKSSDIMPPLPSDKKLPFTPPLPPLPPAPDKVIVKKGYDPKQAAKLKAAINSEEMISPLTGSKIPAGKVQEHMRIGLLDPRWVEQRDKHIKDKMNQESVYAPGAAIEASLKQLAERRTDIFGIGDEETAIGKKIGEEDVRKDDKITWDGHTSSVEAATRAARANITIEDQIHQIHKVKGLLPDEEKEKIGPKPVSGDSLPMSAPPLPPSIPTSAKQPSPLIATLPVTMPPLPTQPPLPPMNSAPARPPVPPPPSMLPPTAPQLVLIPPLPTRAPLMMGAPAPPFTMMPNAAPVAPTFITQPKPPLPPQPPTTGLKHPLNEKSDDEPVVKKQRTEESLEPEQQFLAKNQSPVKFQVLTPVIPEKAEWNLSGQMIELMLPLTDSVAVIKAKIHEITNMPPGKQKLNWDGLFLKDSNSLAYYNIAQGTALQLQLKERGGRKK